ncbi:MAG: single-stranded-DNA-specific exonuclease RecJ [Candidatus Omnitrophica bacterium]|nr:single-stranded-DNA-specific exonuclease RecJ [Candidatus Omnitrophota bacterium]
MHTHKILNIASSSHALREELAKELSISGLLAQLLINRGITDPESAGRFLNVKLGDLRDPFSFGDMRAAVRLIDEAGKLGKPIMVFGDYDVDGITSIALLKTALLERGFKATHYLPHRIKEGYGLTPDIHQVAAEQGVGLLITADCGISNHDEVRRLKERGIRVVITDHHEPDSTRLPSADAIINPKVKGSGYAFRDLAGVGVAYKLAQALLGRSLEEELDLVALGTIADSVPLVDENRIIAKAGLECIVNTQRPGLKALIDKSGIKRRRCDTTLVSFMLAPRINASGRMDTAQTSLDLLLSSDDDQARILAGVLETHNRLRQKTESRIMSEAEDLIDKEVNFKEHKVIVIAKENWHHGVLGIVASKLADRFYRPAVVISLEEEMGKGSARSIKSFHLFDALNGCRDHLHAFGGHSHAAGLVITRDSIDDFRRTLNRLAHDTLTLEDLLPSLDIDMEVNFSQVHDDLVMEIERLAPFGHGNPEPLLLSRNLTLRSEPRVMGRETIKFWVTDGQRTYQALGFGMSGFKNSLMSASSFDMAYTPRIDTWGGMHSLVLEAKDLFFR